MTTGPDSNPILEVLDEGNPLVRAVQAPFDAGMGQFYRDINDANAEYQDTMKELDKQIAEREEKLRELAEKTAAEQPEAPRSTVEQASRWDYDNPLSADQPAAKPVAPVADEQRPDWDYDNPLSSGAQHTQRPNWSATPAKPETESASGPRHAAPVDKQRGRHSAESDEDYFDEGWMR